MYVHPLSCTAAHWDNAPHSQQSSNCNVLSNRCMQLVHVLVVVGGVVVGGGEGGRRTSERAEDD